MSDYVTKELHDANMAEIRALMAASEARHEKLSAEIRGDVQALNIRIDDMNKQFDGVNQRIDDMRDNQTQNLARWGMIMAVVVGLVQVAISYLTK